MVFPLQLLEKLDNQWADGAGASIRALLKELPAGEEAFAVELCAADLEWRWRASAMQRTVPIVPRSLPATPRACDYRTLLGDQWNHVDCQRNLLEAEWCARSIWGDSPDVDEFALQLPTCSDWNTELARLLSALVPLEVVFKSKSLKQPLKYHVSHEFVIGRQAEGEQETPAWLDESQRLIVANACYRVLSREQLRVRRTRFREVELVNVSSGSRCNWDNRKLAPGESTRLDLPFSITVAKLEITVDCDSQSLPQ